MTDTSPILAMPYIQPAQAQKHVTHNEALSLLDVIVQLAVLSADMNTPPTTAVEGDRYIVADGGQAAWAGHDHEIAVFVEASWQFVRAQPGWVAQVIGSGAEIVFDGSVWGMRGLSGLPGLGVNASFDSYNRLVVASDAVLLNNAGAGHQLKINKAAEGDTASVVFQTGFGGRAEMGTTGSDDFTLKVSAEGGSWVEALRVEAATGRVSAPVSGWREMLQAARTYFVDPQQGDDAKDGLGAGAEAFATLARAIAATRAIDTGGHDITIQCADGAYFQSTPAEITTPLVGCGRLILQGNSAAPELVVMEGAGEVISASTGDVILRGVTLQNSSATDPALVVTDLARVALDQVRFGPAGGHIRQEGGSVSLAGGCAIAGDATYHLHLEAGARFDGNGQEITLESTPDFSVAYMICDGLSHAIAQDMAFVGSATGQSYAVSANAVIVAGATALPGDVAGSAQTGGILV